MPRLLLAFALLIGLALPAAAAAPDAMAWQRLLGAARGQTVHLFASGGPTVTAFLAWARDELNYRFGIRLEHVPADPGTVVARLAADKAAGRTSGGDVDLLWVSGVHFAAMKAQGLLAATPWAEGLPNAALVDREARPVLSRDSAVPVEGLESPWGLAQFSFYYDSALMASPPRSVDALAAWIADHPGRFTYVAPPARSGTGFLEQVLLALVGEAEFLYRPAVAAEVELRLAPLWDWLDTVHPRLWAGGSRFPPTGLALRALFEAGDIDIGMTFNPAEASGRIADGAFPPSVRSFVLDEGSLGVAHFLAMPFNAPAPEAAMVVADFLLSPEAQAHKADERVWGDPSVLAYDRLNAEGRALFDTLDRGVATLPVEDYGRILAEPHPSWIAAIADGWRRRYGAAP